MLKYTSLPVQIGSKIIGGNNPIIIQSMTNTDTANVEATVKQILELNKAGSEIIRITVNNEDSAYAVPQIIAKIRQKSEVPIVGDFHFNGNKLLKKIPECAKSLDKYRINPGNTDDKNFCEMIEIAIKNNKSVRIGVNSGSVDKKILNNLMEKNSQKKNPLLVDDILRKAVIESCLKSAKLAEKLGLPKNKIVLSAKMSGVNSMIKVYEALAKKSNYALHLGLTEAGSGNFGIISSSIALGILLKKGIGDTIRVSITPQANESRTKEVEVCQIILQSLGLKNFHPRVTSCPGCGRTENNYFQKLAEKVNANINQNLEKWRKKYPGIENLRIAVMGCVVNGPGESSHADIGISLPGKMEKPFAPVYIEGKHYKNLKGNNIDEQFLKILETYIKNKFK